MRLGEKEEVTYEAVTTALRKAVWLNRAIQARDGHWAAEIAGPLFYTPPLVSKMKICKYFSKYCSALRKLSRRQFPKKFVFSILKKTQI